MTDAELVALAVAQRSDSFGPPIPRAGGAAAAGWFPCLPDQSQYNRRLRRLTPWIASVRLRVAELIAEGRVRLANGTLLSCTNYPGCAKRSHFAGHAGYGYSPSKSQFIWGMRLVVFSDLKGSRSAMTWLARRRTRA